MPSPVNQRAEKILLEISSDLTNIQSAAFSMQDKLADKVNNSYIEQSSLLKWRPFLEIASSVAYVWVAKDTTMFKDALGLQDDKAILDFVNTISKSTTSAFIDPSRTANEANLQRLNSGMQENSSFHTSLDGAKRTHDAALQRLQNMESANRQGG